MSLGDALICGLSLSSTSRRRAHPLPSCSSLPVPPTRRVRRQHRRSAASRINITPRARQPARERRRSHTRSSYVLVVVSRAGLFLGGSTIPSSAAEVQERPAYFPSGCCATVEVLVWRLRPRRPILPRLPRPLHRQYRSTTPRIILYSRKMCSSTASACEPVQLPILASSKAEYRRGGDT